MDRVKKVKPTLESIFFVTPEQRLLRFLITESTTPFTPRVLSSRLKGVRGLGGVDGIMRIVQQLNELGMVNFVDNNRAVIAENEHLVVKLMKTFSAVCDLEGLKILLEPLSSKGILFGSRANGAARSDSDYDIFVVTDQKDEVVRVAESYPLGKPVEVVAWTEDEYLQIEKKDADFARKLEAGIVLWGSTW